MIKSSSAIRPADNNDSHSWNAHIEHPLQTWEWGNFRKKMGIDVVRLVVEKDKEKNQYWQLTFHKIPHTPFTIGYFPKGPVPDQDMVLELITLGKQKNALFIQLEPNVLKINDPKFQISNLIPSYHPLFMKFTFILDLTKSEDELLKAMHPKTRYNIRLAQKHNVLIKEDSSDRAFQDYIKLTEETTRRQGFYAHDNVYHEAMWNTMKNNGIARLFTARYKGEVVSAWIIFCLHDTLYYPYGASSREYREVMAPNLLLWEIVQWGKKNRYKKFDLWGALGQNPDTHDPWYGFHRFKEGYRPELVEFVGSYDLIINPVLYKLYCIGDRVRWKILKLKTNLKFITN